MPYTHSDLMKAVGAAENLFSLMDRTPSLPPYDTHAQLRRLDTYQVT